MGNVYTSVNKNYIQRNGFVMVSNLLLDYQQELGISELELSFIIKIMKNKSGYCIHDDQLDPTVSSKTLQRRRLSLKEKGYLNFSTVKEQDSKTGTFSTKGISYDLSPLEEKLQMISDKLEEEKLKNAKEEIKEQKLVIEEENENTPLGIYKKEYKEQYGVPYIPTEYELNKYEAMEDEEKKLLLYIFQYCKENNLIGKIVPRLSLFFKTKFRFDDLKRFVESKNEVIEEVKETEFPDLSKEIKETYLMYYKTMEPLNEQFYGKVDTYCYRCRNNITGEINKQALFKILNGVFKNTKVFNKDPNNIRTEEVIL